jgi:hypothetical protein
MPFPSGRSFVIYYWGRAVFNWLYEYNAAMPWS